MRLRGTNVSSVVKHSIGCKKEDVLLNPQEIESILLLGGDVEKVISTIIDAKKKGRDLSWKEILKEDKDKKFLRDDADKNVKSPFSRHAVADTIFSLSKIKSAWFDFGEKSLG